MILVAAPMMRFGRQMGRDNHVAIMFIRGCKRHCALVTGMVMAMCMGQPTVSMAMRVTYRLGGTDTFQAADSQQCKHAGDGEKGRDGVGLGGHLSV